jgi:hypothetical protein
MLLLLDADILQQHNSSLSLSKHRQWPYEAHDTYHAFLQNQPLARKVGLRCMRHATYFDNILFGWEAASAADRAGQTQYLSICLRRIKD